jgi:hypothetical protein
VNRSRTGQPIIDVYANVIALEGVGRRITGAGLDEPALLQEHTDQSMNSDQCPNWLRSQFRLALGVRQAQSAL